MKPNAIVKETGPVGRRARTVQFGCPIPVGIVAACVFLTSLFAGTGLAGRSAKADELVPLRVDRAKLAPVELRGLRFQDPDLKITESVRIFPPGIQALWRKALTHDESDLRRQAADAVVTAHDRGMRVTDGFLQDLAKLLEDDALHPLTRLSVARALVALDAREAAPLLARHADRGGLDYALAVEPALARWKHAARVPAWRELLSDEQAVPARRVLAIRCLGIMEDTDSLPVLERIAAERRETPAVRLEAARAVARVDSRPAAALAATLRDRSAELNSSAGPRALLDKLAAVLLLQTATSEDATRLLEQLAEEPQPAIAAAAIQRLLEIAPRQVVARSDGLLANPDAKVRLLTAYCLATQPDPVQVERFGRLLSDPHPDVRRFARATLLELAKRDAPEGQDSLDGAVRQVVVNVLGGDDWRGLEQAALLAGQLDHEPTADRMLQLLDHSRPEVMLTAGWALREMAIPETLPPILANVQGKTRVLGGQAPPDQPAPELTDWRLLYPEQVAFLFELFGRLEYREAEELLRVYVPKDHRYGHSARAAAIWSLGILLAEEGDDALAAQLAERLADLNPFDPEHDEVRRFSAVTMGRMKSESQLERLRQFYASEGDSGYVGRACGWAVSQITGEPLRDPGTAERLYTGWFLEPLPPPVSEQTSRE